MSRTEGSGKVTSLKRAAANRRNAQLSTGPRTKDGKRWSRRNALKHGILASALLVPDVEGAEGRYEFSELLGALSQELAPVGAEEVLLVEQIATCWWRLKRALRCEATLLLPLEDPEKMSRMLVEAVKECEEIFRRHGISDQDEVAGENEETDSSKELNIYSPSRLPIAQLNDYPPSRLPDGQLDRILRYETTIQRQLAFAMNQLERRQGRRAGKHVPAPVNVQVSSD